MAKKDFSVTFKSELDGIDDLTRLDVHLVTGETISGELQHKCADSAPHPRALKPGTLAPATAGARQIEAPRDNVQPFSHNEGHETPGRVR
ncbi:MAG: hypothetical protein KIT84_43230 [Labilithrix sp.]|nr:hypothetical protein [Labilithrix sp.]MCW5817891.1 hypothetical protein [Labilithrix sp.]